MSTTTNSRQRTDTACLQNNCAVLLLRRNQREAAAADGELSEFDEKEARVNALDAVRRFRRAIALTSSTTSSISRSGSDAGADGGDASETQVALADDERGLAWYHRRLLAGERGGSAATGGIGGSSSHRSLRVPPSSGIDSHHNPESSRRSLLLNESFSHGDASISSTHQSHQDVALSPRKNGFSALNDADGGVAAHHHGTPATGIAYGCSGAAAVLGSPMRTSKNLPLGIGSVGRSLALPEENDTAKDGIDEAKPGIELRQRRRGSRNRKRSESFPAHILGGGGGGDGSNRTDRNMNSAAFFGLPPAPPLFESNSVDAAKSLADAGNNTIPANLRRDRSQSFFLPSSTCGNSSFSCGAGGSGVLASVSSSGTPSPTSRSLGRPRAKSFGLSQLLPPPLNEELSIGSQNNNDLSTSSPTAGAANSGGAAASEHQMRMQEYREIREKTRREAIVADVVHQTAYHAPVADEVTPLGLEFMGDYISMVLPKNGGVVGSGGRRKGGEWAQVVRKGAISTKCDKEDVPCIDDIAASARINLAIVLYYGYVGAGDLDAANDTHQDSEDDEEEKKDANSPGQGIGQRSGEDIVADICDEDNRLESALGLLQEAADVASSPILRSVATINAGVVLFRRNKVRDAFATFQKAKECIENIEENAVKCGKHLDLPHPTYLRSTTLLNVATLAVRLGDVDTALSATTEIDGGQTSGTYRAPRGAFGGSGSCSQVSKPLPAHMRRRIRWLQSVSSHHVRSLIELRRPPTSDTDSDANSNAPNKPTAILDSYNTLLASARKELGHSHPVVGSILYHRGDALFDKQQLHPAMLSYLAALKVMENHTGTPDPTRRSDRLTYSRIWYGVARTLHDREEFTDALRAYQRTLELQTSLTGGSDVCVNVVQTLCNVGRVRHALGDIDGALEVHRRVVRIATALTGGRTGHPFVAARLRALGNLLVEAGRPAEAVRVYADAARSTGEVCVGFREEDIDGTESARQSARVLARAGLPDPCAATA